ncbi:hypothetical protein C8Q74DRAFT_18569 [Fomes fomentarius]|nr:hypothetical protein C8Q74DRAFT_18569 [Fomes fomentarius]
MSTFGGGTQVIAVLTGVSPIINAVILRRLLCAMRMTIAAEQRMVRAALEEAMSLADGGDCPIIHFGGCMHPDGEPMPVRWSHET